MGKKSPIYMQRRNYVASLHRGTFGRATNNNTLALCFRLCGRQQEGTSENIANSVRDLWISRNSYNLPKPTRMSVMNISTDRYMLCLVEQEITVLLLPASF